jgi:hypothetical protein
MDILLKYSKTVIDWEKLCLEENLKGKEEFLEDHLEYLNWEMLCRNPTINEAFIEDHIEEVELEWGSLCRNKGMSEDFFRRNMKHIHVIDTVLLRSHPNVSEGFLKEFDLI